MRSGVLVLDRRVPLPTWALRALGVGAFTLLTALGASVRVPLPGTPVPVTLQTFFVLAAGLMLGARDGAVSQFLYLALGAAGVPVFAGVGGFAALLGPSGGYLLGFVAAPIIVAMAARRGQPLLGLILGELVILGSGATQLGLLTRLGPGATLAMGVAPFLAGDALKIALAWSVARLRNASATR